MYEELMKRLRETSMDFGEADHVSVMLLEAANAIEELSGLVDHYGGETGIKNLQEYASKYWDLLKNTPRWIPVTERLPELDKPVLIFSYGRICFGRLACEKSEAGYPIFAIVEGGLKNCEDKNLWKPIPCPHCGGPLSELRKYRYGGGPIGELARYHRQWYRHCYSCHAEFFVEE